MIRWFQELFKPAPPPKVVQDALDSLNSDIDWIELDWPVSGYQKAYFDCDGTRLLLKGYLYGPGRWDLMDFQVEVDGELASFPDDQWSKMIIDKIRDKAQAENNSRINAAMNGGSHGS